MDHDPLCPLAPSPTTVNRIRERVEETREGRAALERSAEQWCECSLIAEARADERKNAVARINDAHRQRRIRSVGRAIAAVRGES